MDPHTFISETTEAVRPLHLAYTHAVWQAATTGAEEANQREKEAQAALMRFWADEERYETAKRLHEAGHPDAMIARQLKVIYLAAAKAQQDEETIEQLTELEASIRQRYYNFRAEVDGKRLTDNELEETLRESMQSELVRRAWEASKQIGVQVADDVRELGRVRNEAAVKQGFRDYFEKSLQLDEIDEQQLFSLFDQLERETRALFGELKAEMDQARAERFGIEPVDLRPWHYGDRFFQEAPKMGDHDLDAAFESQDPIPLALRTYDGLGMEVGDILDRSDLYPREGKNQHAFCLDLDREGDIRTLNNLESNLRWTTTLLHELGHAVYDKYIDPQLPWILRRPPHTLSTEAIAILMGSLTHDPTWLTQVRGIPESQAQAFSEAARRRDRAQALVFTRWVLVMTHFERALYADPESDLNGLWWDLVRRYQGLTPPEGREAPDWAAKYHVALAPVYYHNYELGALLAEQLRVKATNEFGGLTARTEAGTWLKANVFRAGARMSWSDHAEHATGERLTPDYFIQRLR